MWRTTSSPATGGAGDRLDITTERFHQSNGPLEWHVFSVAHLRLTVHLRRQRTGAISQHGASLDQTMATDALVIRGRMVSAQSFHRAPLWCAPRRIVSDHLP